ncbi:unnamed protein product [Lathyrus sativus]|nr:unnamed protein product [Lathyrus sativus]
MSLTFQLYERMFLIFMIRWNKMLLRGSSFCIFGC